jgi:spermidine synthase
MITHVPWPCILTAKNILVIGGGDGGAVAELCRYRTVKAIDLVEIDPLVVEASRSTCPSPPAA